MRNQAQTVSKFSLVKWFFLHHQVVSRGNLGGFMAVEGQRGQHFWF